MQVKSQDIDPLRTDVAGVGYDDAQESDMFVRSDGENDGDSVGLDEVALPDSGWISPPLSICSSSTESGVTSTEASLADSFNGLDVTGGSVSQEKGEHLNHFTSNVTVVLESSLGETDTDNKQVHSLCSLS